MAKKLETDFVKVKKVEDLEEGFLEVTFYSERFGEFVHNNIPYKDFGAFSFGKKYIGIYEISGMPDFIGDKDVFENICTLSFYLKHLFEGNEKLYSF